MRWRMRSLPQHLLLLVLLATTLVAVVRAEEQPNPVTEAEVTSNTNGQPDENDEEVQNHLTTGLRLEHELVKEQADAPSTVNGSSEGGIVAIHVDAVGGKEQLRPTLRGLSYLATTFLPREYRLTEVLSATREIVAGVRYELLVSAEDETPGEKHLCRLVILEKPWLTTEYGEKYRTLEHTNCSTPTSSIPSDPGVEEGSVRLNPEFDANLRQNAELTPQQMEYLEQQIIVEKVEMLEMTSSTAPPGEDEVTTSLNTTTAVPATSTDGEGLSEAAKSAIDDLFGIASAPSQNANRRESAASGAEVTEEMIVPIRKGQNRAEATDPTTTTTIAPLDQQVQSTFDEVFKTHQEIQKALDEVITNGGGRDVQLKYRPVFDSLLQKVKASIDSYYRTTNGGDANVDTAAFVVRDNTNAGVNGVRGELFTRTVGGSSRRDDQSSQESDEDQQRRDPLPTVNLQPPRFEAPTAVTFGTTDSDEEDGNDQQVLTKEQLAQELNDDQALQRVKKQAQSSFMDEIVDGGKDEKLSKEELAKQLNEDDGKRRGKRDYSGGFSASDFGGHSSGGFGGGSYSGGGYYGGGYYGGYNGGYYGGGYYNPYRRGYYRTPPYYYGHYRGKRSVSVEHSPVGDSIETGAAKPNDPQPPKIERVTMAFGDSEEDGADEVLTKEQLAKQLNADDYGPRQEKRRYYRRSPNYPGNYRDKRNAASSSSTTSSTSNVINLDEPAQEAAMHAIATEAIQRLDQMDPDAYQRMLLEVLDARRVAQRSDNSRTTYVLTVLTANSHCAEEEESKGSDACRERLIPDTTKQCTLEGNHVGGGLVGGATPVDLSGPDHEERIRLGLVGYEEGKHSHFDILFGTVQIVAGTIYRYKIALKDDTQQVYGTCDVKVFYPLPSAPGADKPDYNFDCQDNKEDGDGHRRRRDVVAPKKLNKIPKTGSAQELTPEEYAKEEHQSRVRTGLQKQSALVDGSGNERKVKIVGASVQLVAGRSYTYRLTFPDDEQKRVCKLTVWEKPWLKEKAPEEAFKSSLECPDVVQRAKRDSFCIGCATPLSEAEYGATEHQQRIDKILNFHKVTRGNSLKVINATSQVVAGMKYVYFIEHNNDVCKLTSWEREWLVAKQPKDAYIYTYDCDGQVTGAKTRTRRSLVPGGSRSLTQDELSNTEHIERVDKILVSNGGGSKKSSNARIVSGTVQIVSGKLYKYAVEFEVEGSGSKLCKLSSWERPWLEEKQPTDAYKYTVSCPDDKETQRRQRRHAKKNGASNELTADELKDASHLERIRAGLVSYNSERSKAYTEFEILAGSTQQVAGSLYKYTFRVTSEPDIVCKISIWERVWLDTQDQRKYNVKCTGDDDTEQQPEIKHQPSTPSDETSAPTAAPEKQRRSVRSLKIDDDEHVRHQFDKFKHHHRRRYANSMEHEMRFNIFRNNLFKIDQLNKFERGTAKYGVTKFADMTVAEYRAHTGLVVPKHDLPNRIRNRVATEDDVAGVRDLPRSFDWRDHGAVTEVKNQGSCGSCWAFSAVGNVEGLHQIKTKKLESYSEQELLDCDKVDNGCGGGYMDDAFKAIEQLGGLELETDYPYRAKAEKTCHFNKTLSHVQVTGAVDMPKNETFIAQYLIKNGPIAIGLNANAMQFYRGGISHPWHPLCSKKSIDHGVLIVGYGVKEYPMFNKTLPYWIIKNSWGPSWGEQGYYRIYRGDNSCGVSEMASSAVLA